MMYILPYSYDRSQILYLANMWAQKCVCKVNERKISVNESRFLYGMLWWNANNEWKRKPCQKSPIYLFQMETQSGRCYVLWIDKNFLLCSCTVRKPLWTLNFPEVKPLWTKMRYQVKYDQSIFTRGICARWKFLFESIKIINWGQVTNDVCVTMAL